MTIRTRRLMVATLGVFLLVAALLTSVGQKEKAEAGWACPRPIVTWDMLSIWPSAVATRMGSNWIDLKHRSAAGTMIEGTFIWDETVQYRWCLDGRNPKFTGHIQPYRTCLRVMFKGFRPTGLRGVHWNTQGMHWPSLTAGKRQAYRTGENVLVVNTSAAYKGHWQTQCRAISSPWLSLQAHPQRQVWGHNDLADSKDKSWRMFDNDAWLPYSPATDKRNILR